MANNLEPFKELYDTLTRIRDLPDRSETLITQALELTKKIEVKYGDLQDETNNLTSYIGKADQEHIATRNELDEANTDLVRAYAQIGRAYMRAVEDSEDEQ